MKRYYNALVVCTSIFILLSGCAIDERTTFNNDFSGESVSTVDLSSFIKILSEKDSTGKAKAGFTKGFRDKIAAEMGGSTNPYASHISINYDSVNNHLSMKCTFDNLDMMNKINATMRESNTQMSRKKVTYVDYNWKKKDKVLVMPGVEGLESLAELTKSRKGEENLDSKITYSIVRRFPKEIEKVNDSRLQLSEDKKELSLKTTLAELDKKPLKEIVVTFKN
ncbi:hypothetical protein [Xanthocytophaga flava]|uniref:hypothetical protein n=1 Tax=Xanthocytophaga flava TaxID=3048013 RepID=UPI0028D3490D|nr:hypothetical protein [Xanthocytophaga flavus]MDJ1470402.1 hypothetical protein [Xanthocytophaga flavus]